MARLANELPRINRESGLVNVVIDTPRGSRNKYKFDEESGQWRLSKVLPQGASFPFDFGFVPSTAADDGDPIDVLLIADQPAFTGCVAPAGLIGVLQAEQTEKDETIRNDRLVAVVETPYNPPRYQRLDDVDDPMLDEIEYFFTAYNQAEEREFKPLNHCGPDRVNELVKQAIERGKKK